MTEQGRPTPDPEELQWIKDNTLDLPKEKGMRHLTEYIEKLAGFLIVLHLISLVGGYPLNVFILRNIDPPLRVERALTVSGIAALQGLLVSIVKIGIALWLFFDARRSKSKKWSWSLLGLFFGVSALILYFVHKIHLGLVRRDPSELRV